MISESLYSSGSIEWETPTKVFRILDSEFGFNLDPCATQDNAKCARFFTLEEDGLKQEWTGTVFVNPPYGREVGRWVEKAYQESQKGAVVVCLIHSRTDTRWWHEWGMKAAEMRFIRGRLKFGNPKNSCPFPSVVVIFRPPGTVSRNSGNSPYHK